MFHEHLYSILDNMVKIADIDEII